MYFRINDNEGTHEDKKASFFSLPNLNIKKFLKK